MTLLFTITEALIGRSLVKEGLVNQSTDLLRLVVMPLHLINTSLLLLSCVMTAENVKYGSLQRADVSRKRKRWIAFSLGAIGLILTTGAIAALGSHLDPSSSLVAGLAKDLSSESHLAVRLRWIHPLLAMTAAGIFVVILSSGALQSLRLSHLWVRRLAFTFFLTVTIGILTLGLLSPVWLKVTHLIMANSLVIVASLCLFHTLYPQNDG
jgi:heme A synthase